MELNEAEAMGGIADLIEQLIDDPDTLLLIGKTPDGYGVCLDLGDGFEAPTLIEALQKAVDAK